MMILAVGTTTPIADVEIVRVDSHPVLGTMNLRAGDVTIFYEKHIQPTKWLGADRPIWGSCPPRVFDLLVRACEKVATEAAAGTRTIDTIPRNLPGLAAKAITIAAPKLNTGPIPVQTPATAEGTQPSTDPAKKPEGDDA